MQPELNRLSKEGRWDEMARLIDDDVLNTFAVVADADHLADEILCRYGSLVGGVRLNVPYLDDPELWGAGITQLKTATVGPCGAAASAGTESL